MREDGAPTGHPLPFRGLYTNSAGGHICVRADHSSFFDAITRKKVEATKLTAATA